MTARLLTPLLLAACVGCQDAPVPGVPKAPLADSAQDVYEAFVRYAVRGPRADGRVPTYYITVPEGDPSPALLARLGDLGPPMATRSRCPDWDGIKDMNAVKVVMSALEWKGRDSAELSARVVCLWGEPEKCGTAQAYPMVRVAARWKVGQE